MVNKDFTLLLSVFPAFLKFFRHLALSRKSDAVDARKELDARTPYFTWLYTDMIDLLGLLEDSSIQYVDIVTDTQSANMQEMEEQNTSIQALLHKLKKLIRCLREPERTPSDEETEPKYERLLKLQGLGPSFSMRELKKIIRFKSNIDRQCRAIHKALKDCRNSITIGSGKKQGPMDRLGLAVTVASTNTSTRMLWDYPSVRKHANTLHALLLKNWGCNCKLTRRFIKVRLTAYNCICDIETPQCECEHAFEILLCGCKMAQKLYTAHDNTHRWLASRVGAVEKPNEGLRFDNLQATLPTSGSSKSDTDSGLWMNADNICDLIQACAEKNEELSFRVIRGRLMYQKSHAVETSPSHPLTYLSGSFAHLLKGRWRKLAGRKERFILAVLLARAVLNLQEGPWCPHIFDPVNIFFTQTWPASQPNLRRPYLSTKPGEVSAPEPPELWEHPQPSLFSLGCLLIAMEVGRPVNLANLKQEWRKACKTKNRDYGNAFDLYFQAAEACISSDTFKRGQNYHDETFVKEVHTKVVSPLEQVLFGSFPDLEPDPKSSEHSEKSSVNGNLDYETIRELEDIAQDTPISASQRHRLEIGATIHENRDSTEAKQSKLWLQEWKNASRTLFPSDQAEEYGERVKIAILDTGVQIPESSRAFFPRGVPVRECRSWLSSNDSAYPDQGLGLFDVDGHGTHATGLLVKIAPQAEIYAARVFQSRNDGQSPATVDEIGERIANAIKVAVDNWEVDIITMSFGFVDEVDSIETALKYAYAKNILVFAAASNSGGNSQPLWPARSSSVIGVLASTGLGNKYHGNPTRSSHADNFSVLGTAVESWWPEHMGQDRKISSGTSCATPIMAGIAATVMAVLRQPKRVEKMSQAKINKRSRLGSADGMRKVLREMVIGERDGYDYVVPWKFLRDDGYESPTTLADNILQLL